MKKVLATTMAGAMIFGMSSAAFAATALEIKPYNGDSYDYAIDLYLPQGEVPIGSEYDWGADAQAAFNAYQLEYDRLMNRSTSSAIAEYFDSRAANENVAAKYIAFYNAAKAYAKSDVVFDLQLTDLTTNIYAGGTMEAYSRAPYGENDGAADGDLQWGNGGNDWGEVHANNLQRAFGTFANPETILERKARVSGTAVTKDGGDYVYANKDKAEINKNEFTLYNYSEHDSIDIQVNVKHGDSLRLDVNSGKITATRKKMNTGAVIDEYKVTIKPNWDVRDLVDDNDDLFSYTLEVDIESNDEKAKDPGTFYIKGKGAYSDFQMVEPDDRLQVVRSDKTPGNDKGCAFVFDQKLTDETRIKCNQYVDLYMKGNYGTDIENLRVLTDADEVKEIEDFFEDVDIDYYDFIGAPKFATEVTVLVDGDANSYIYEFDKKTGEIENITDSAEYTSDGWKFKRKNLKTYVLMEEEYNGGNVKADKEEVVEEEPEASEPEVSEPATDNVDTSVKPNPGTGAYPEF